MIDAPFRAFLPKVSQPLISFYESRDFSPNQITVAGFMGAMVAAAAVGLGWWWLALVLWWASRLLDGTDGIYARHTGRVTEFGGYLDITLDMASYSVMILGFYFRRPELAVLWVAILIFYVLAITTALSLGAIERKKGVDGDNRSLKLAAGLAEGGETGIAYSLLLIFPEYTFSIALIWLAVLALTILARTRLAWNELGRH